LELPDGLVAGLGEVKLLAAYDAAVLEVALLRGVGVDDRQRHAAAGEDPCVALDHDIFLRTEGGEGLINECERRERDRPSRGTPCTSRHKTSLTITRLQRTGHECPVSALKRDEGRR
jgi:hypothetical protein